MAISPTQRTIRALRNQGMVCGIVERFNPHVGPHGIRQDLFGCIDIIALDPERGVIGVQSCGQDFAGHKRKMLEERCQEVTEWLSTPGTVFELYGWRKVLKRRGLKQKIWKPRLARITIENDELVFTEIKG